MRTAQNIKSEAKSYSVRFALLLLLLFAFAILDLYFGSVKIPLSDILTTVFSSQSDSSPWSSIIFNFRIPKLITAVLAGAALSVSGLQMQTVFRNPLAGPYVLGISAGASLGVAIVILTFSSAISFTYMNLLGNWTIVLIAWMGAGLVLLVIFVVSLRVKDIMTILILGILLGSATSAIVSILQFFSNESMLKTYVIWTLGSLGGVTRSQLNVLVPAVGLGLVLVILSGKILNALMLGENYAKSLGLNIRNARLLVFLSTSLLAGSITAFCGPIGFIGIAVPHITKMIFKTADHRILIWGCIIVGSLIMIISDIISQLPGYQTVLPINSVTALIGIPIVLYLIIKNQRISIWA